MTQAEIIGVIADHHRWYPALHRVEILAQVALFAMFALLQFRLRRIAAVTGRDDFVFQQPKIRAYVRRMGFTMAAAITVYTGMAALEWRLDGASTSTIADVSQDAERRVYAAQAQFKLNGATAAAPSQAQTQTQTQAPAASVSATATPVQAAEPAAPSSASSDVASAQPQAEPQGGLQDQAQDQAQDDDASTRGRVQVDGAGGVVLREKPHGAALRVVPNGSAVALTGNPVTSDARAWVHVRLPDLSSGWVVASAIQR